MMHAHLNALLASGFDDHQAHSDITSTGGMPSTSEALHSELAAATSTTIGLAPESQYFPAITTVATGGTAQNDWNIDFENAASGTVAPYSTLSYGAIAGGGSNYHLGGPNTGTVFADGPQAYITLYDGNDLDVVSATKSGDGVFARVKKDGSEVLYGEYTPT